MMPLPQLTRFNAPAASPTRPVEDVSVATEIQAALFELRTVKDQGRSKKIPGINAYMRQLSLEVVSKKRGSASEQMFYLQKLSKSKVEDNPAALRMDNLSKQIDEHRKRVALLRTMFTGYYCWINDDVRKAFGLDQKDVYLTPYWYCREAEKNFSILLERRRRRGRAYDVGYGKPPRSHQFKAGQSGNPRGRQPKAMLDELLSMLLSGQTVTQAGGRRAKFSQMRIQASQTLTAAMEGDRTARKAVRGYVDLLEKANLLVPPPVRVRKKRDKSRDFEYQFRHLFYLRYAKHEAVVLYTGKFGRVQEFEFSFEVAMIDKCRQVAITTKDQSDLEMMLINTALPPDVWAQPGAKLEACDHDRRLAGSGSNECIDYEHEARMRKEAQSLERAKIKSDLGESGPVHRRKAADVAKRRRTTK